MTKVRKQDLLTEDEIKQFDNTLLVPGRPYLWVLGFGWGIVGYYIKNEGPFNIRLAHGSHFRNAGVDYGVLVNKGPALGCEWRYEGNMTLGISHIIRTVEYYGKVNRGNII